MDINDIEIGRIVKVKYNFGFRTGIIIIGAIREIDEKFINLCPAFEIFDNNCKTFFGSIKVFREYCESLLKITEDDLFQYWKLIRINSNKRIIETVECLIFEEMEKL